MGQNPPVAWPESIDGEGQFGSQRPSVSSTPQKQLSKKQKGSLIRSRSLFDLEVHVSART